MTVVVFFTAGSVVFWRAVIAEIEQWAAGLDAKAQTAAVTKLTVEARVQSLLIGYSWTLLGILVLTVVTSVVVYRRQVRRRGRYDRQIAVSVSDAAALVL